MTNERAILILEHIKELNTMDPETITEEDVKALDTAIRALKTESFLIDNINDAQATIRELLNRIYGMQARERIQEHLIPVSERLPESRISYLRGDKQ